MLSRLTGQLFSLVDCGAARIEDDGVITLVLRADEASQGGMAMITMRVELRCPDCTVRTQSAACPRCGGAGIVEDLFSAWLAVPPGVKPGEGLVPAAELAGMVEAVRFRVAIRPTP